MSNDVDNPVENGTNNMAAKPRKGSFWRLLGYGGLGFVLLAFACWGIGLSNANRGVRAVFRAGGVAQDTGYKNINVAIQFPYDPLYFRYKQWPRYYWLQIDRDIEAVAIDKCKMKPDDYQVLARFPVLEKLRIQQEQLKHLRFLGEQGLPRRRLSIVNGSLDLSGLESFTHIKDLAIEGNGDHVNLSSLARLRDMNRLTIHLHGSLPKGAFKPIGQCEGLEYLAVMGESVDISQLLEISDSTRFMHCCFGWMKMPIGITFQNSTP